nr:structure-specific endonuclease subunit SLX4 isoform X2 [Leptinotarsa decemlineata]
MNSKNMKKNQKKDHGLIKSFILNPMCNNQASSSFRSQVPNRNSDSESFDSPYKNSLSEIKQITLINDGADDFRTPKPIKKALKRVPNKKVTVKKRSSKKTKKFTNSIEKYTKNNFQNLDVNPEHLQMALALSKSTFAEENPEEFKKSEEQDFPVFLSPEKIPKRGTVLERYGFRPGNKPKLHPELHVDHSEESKRRKYSKFRFVTPTLHIRTKEEREELITAKISLIISQERRTFPEYPNFSQDSLISDILQKYHCQENHILNIGMIGIDELKNFCYYCCSLEVPPSRAVYGCLLKKWEDIIGREKSPERYFATIESESSDSKNDDCQNTTFQNDSEACNFVDRQLNCPSPDLFDSDDESSLKTSDSIERFPSSSINMSPFRSSGSLCSTIQTLQKCSGDMSLICLSNNGIEHYESFNSDFHNLSKEVVISKETEKCESHRTREEKLIDSTQNSSSSGSCSLDKHNTEDDNVLDEVPKISSSQEKISEYSAIREDTEGNEMEFDDFFDLTQRFPPQNRSNLVYEENQSGHIIKDTSINQCDNKDQLEEFHTNNRSPSVELPSQAVNTDEDKYIEAAELSLDKSFDVKGNSEHSIKRLSFRSDEHSEDCNNTNNLNITDYITEMMNSLPDEAALIEYNSENEASFLKNTEDTVEGRVYVDEPPQNRSDFMCENKDSNSTIVNGFVDHSEIVDNQKENDADVNPTPVMDYESFKQSKINIDSPIKRYSFMSDRYSKGYNNTNDLNVTDFITQILNSQSDQGFNENNSDNSSQTSCSQETIIISDEELNYSSIHCRKQKNDDFYNLSVFDEVGPDQNEDVIDKKEIDNIHLELRSKYGSQSSQQSLEEVELSQHSQSDKPEGNQVKEHVILHKIEVPEPVPSKTSTSTAQINNGINVSTPDNNLFIKTTDVTPMINYDQMDTPSIRRELDKFGFKPLKRPRAIKLLKYIYETTHPMVSSSELSSPEEEEDGRTVKRRKSIHFGEHFLDGEGLIFERKISSKIVSCRIPLQIVWYNFLSENPQLEDNILLYEPIQLEVVQSMLKEQSGCKFHIEDLITFLDKKCITFRTTQTQSSRNKRN